MMAVYEIGVAFEDVGGIAQHGVAEIDGRGSSVDGAAKAILDEQGNASGVIDVGMGEDHRFDGSGIDGKIPVEVFGLFAPALEHAAIEQVLFAIHFEVVHGAGHSAGRAVKCEFDRQVKDINIRSDR